MQFSSTGCAFTTLLWLVSSLVFNSQILGQQDSKEERLEGDATEAIHTDASETVEYLAQVKPVFVERCVSCHGALKQEAGLRLDTAKLAILGGQSGAAIVPGNLSDSLLLNRVQSTELSERMPPDGEPLKAEQISVLKKWVQQNAIAPADEEPEKDPRDHWAFKMPITPVLPEVDSQPDRRGSMNPNPIDVLLGLEHQKHGLKLHCDADPGILLRRLSLDLTGLPPTLAETKAFMADDSNEAYEKNVQRLLGSPQYGERWGRHWMDIWRYSDWWGLGNEVRNSQKHMWHWRDWIVESLNANKGYDQMILEMLAADEMYPEDLDRLRASGFLARQYFKFNRTSWLDGTVEHTAKAFLGLTINCAKCHDHKYDPISQVDYYQFRAVFEPYQIRIDLVPGATDPDKNGIPRAFDCNLDAKTFLHIRGDDRNPDNTKPIEPSIPAAFLAIPFEINAVTLPLESQSPGMRPFVFESYKIAARRIVEEAQLELEKATKNLAAIQATRVITQSNLEGTESSEPALGGENNKEDETEIEKAKFRLALAEKTLASALAHEKAIAARHLADKSRSRNPLLEMARLLAEEAFRSQRIADVADGDKAIAKLDLEAVSVAAEKASDIEKKKEAALKALEKAREASNEKSLRYTPIQGAYKTLESNVESEESRSKPFPGTSTGRRTALANWITHPSNPLTARVAVNHIWMRHMGKPLVSTTFDFGRKGATPTHPQLLDWLANELIKSGWDMKHLHRLIVTSQAYRNSSSNAFASEENLIRDPENLYYWRTNTNRMDAQSIRDSLLHLAGDLDLKMGGPSIDVKEEQSNRRSLYFVHSHNEHNKFLSMFDDANVLDCYRRAESIVPQQALALENSKLVADISETIVAQMDAEVSAESFLRDAFLKILSYKPSEKEVQLVLRAYDHWKSLAKQNNRQDPERFARQQIVQSLLNHNDFVTVR